jgi:glycosyltransferase involved in cell wall biosynthesis
MMGAPEKTRRRVLYASFEYIPTFSGKACWSAEETRHLSTRYDMDVLSLKSDDLSHIERFGGARLLRVPVGTGPFLPQVQAFQRALKRQLESEEYGLCHFTSIWEGMVLGAYKKNTGFKLVFEIHSLPSVDFRYMHPEESAQIESSFSFRQIEEYCFSISDVLLVGSDLLKEHLIRRGVTPERIEVNPPAVDLDLFSQAEKTAPQPATILYLGSLYPWQGVVSLLMATAQLPKQMPIKLLLVVPKNDPWMREVMGKVHIMGLDKIVEIIPSVPFEKLPEVVSRAMVCVSPLSNHEHNQETASIPHKVLVYQACCRPVIAARQPAIRKLVENNVHGLLYPPGDIRELTECIRKLLQDKELSQQMGNRGRIHQEEAFSLKKSISKLIDVYQQFIGPPKEVDVAVKSELDTLPKVSLDGAHKQNYSSNETIPNLPLPEFAEPDSIILDSNKPDTAPRRVEGVTPITHMPPPLKREEPGTTAAPAKEPEEIIFFSVEMELGGSPQTPESRDQWQVLKLSDVDYPDEEKTPTSPRFFLGGPPHPVEDETEDTPDEKINDFGTQVTARNGRSLQQIRSENAQEPGEVKHRDDTKPNFSSIPKKPKKD